MSTKLLNCLLFFASYASAKPIIYLAIGGKHHTAKRPIKNSAPFIAGDSFRAAADFVVGIPFDTDDIKDGDTIFVRTGLLDFFFNEVHPHITKKYILITHDSDLSAPGVYAKYLHVNRLIAWFGQNSDGCKHPKFFPIPIGVCNRKDGELLTRLLQCADTKKRDIIAYVNFKPTNPERNGIKEHFKQPFCTHAAGRSYLDYMHDLMRTQFVVSPEGAGTDCYRTWESLLMGAIPIVKHSPIDPIFEGLPVLLVNDWAEVTEQFLQQKYQEMQGQVYDYERMFFAYWWDKIEQVKKAARKK